MRRRRVRKTTVATLTSATVAMTTFLLLKITEPNY